MKFYLAHFKKDLQTFKKNGVYWFDEVNAAKIPPQYVTLYPSELIEKHNEQPNMLLVRSAGIGDIIALSAFCFDGWINTVILTQEKYKPLQPYFAEPIKFKSFQEPIFTVKFPNTVEQECKRWGQMVGDEQIEQGSLRNWFEILHESINANLIPEYGRPQLKSITQTIKDGTCIVVPTASCVNRSADRDILKMVAERHYPKVIMADEQKWSIKEYLHHLDRAEMVISVDTSAIHFREGIGKPAIGLYGAFSTESRTKYYQYTKSIDIKSSCPIQPCFKHDDQTCPYLPQKATAAPCLTGGSLEQQLEEAIITIKQ